MNRVELLPFFLRRERIHPFLLYLSFLHHDRRYFILREDLLEQYAKGETPVGLVLVVVW